MHFIPVQILILKQHHNTFFRPLNKTNALECRYNGVRNSNYTEIDLAQYL